MDNIEDRILDILRSKGGQKTREIAVTFSIDIQVCKTILWKMKNSHLIWQDSSYNWYSGNEKNAGRDKPIIGDTPLSKICRYYLQCISLDDENGVSLFARSNTSLDYVELSIIPDLPSHFVKLPVYL